MFRCSKLALVAAAGAAICWFGSDAALAQDSGAAPAAAVQADAPDVHARKIALIHRYFEVLNFRARMNSMMASMLPVMMAQQKDYAALPPEGKKILDDAVKESMSDFTARVMSRFDDLYASILTEDELKAMVGFYESPVGKSVIVKTGQLTAMTGPLLKQMLPDLQADLKARICKKVACPTEGAKPAAQSSS